MKIANNKVKTPKSKRLSDEDYINDLIITLKNIEKNYVISLTEMSNESLYKLLKKDFDNICDLQRSCFETMFSLGWYTLEAESDNKILQKLNSLNGN